VSARGARILSDHSEPASAATPISPRRGWRTRHDD
jgi:hypothetical protein